MDTNILLQVLLLVGGFVILIKGADWLVDGASAIAKRFGISDLVIGLTVVAFGTSMPEFVVNMVSVAEGSTDLAITNILNIHGHQSLRKGMFLQIQVVFPIFHKLSFHIRIHICLCCLRKNT